MNISVGIDIAEVHWASAIDANGELLLDQALPNEPGSLADFIASLRQLEGHITIGLDVIGGIASLTQAMLDAAGFRLVHVSGLAVNRARQGTVGGENKSAPRDARVSADQVRVRHDLRTRAPSREADLEIRLLVSRRTDLVQEQTRRIARMRDLLSSIHPGLERCLELTRKSPLCLLTHYVTPEELRAAGRAQLLSHLRQAGAGSRAERLADAALSAAHAQDIAVPGERVAADLIRELAHEALAKRQRIRELERELSRLLEHHTDAPLMRSLPGMGLVLTAELIALTGDLSHFRSAAALASAAGLAPVLRQSGKLRFRRRPTGGNKGLKRVFYQSAFCSLAAPESRAYYTRKRAEGKRHHQALIALARRRINVLWAIVHSRQPYDPKFAGTS